MPRPKLPARFTTSTYSPQRASALVCRLSGGRALTSVCKDADMPSYNTVMAWARADPFFAEQVEAVRDRSGKRRSPGNRGRRTPYDAALARRLCAALAEGFSLKAVCAHPACPVTPHTVQAWVRRDPDFAALYQAACAPRPTANGLRIGRGRGGGGRGGAYTPALGEQIIDRVLQGRALTDIARDPDMPSAATIRKWARRHIEFDSALWEARRFQLDLAFDAVLDAAETGAPVAYSRPLVTALIRCGYRA